MKRQFQFASIVFFCAGLVFAQEGDVKTFLLLSAFSLGIYSFIEIDFGNVEKIYLKDWRKIPFRRVGISPIGKILEVGSMICLVGHFLCP